MGVENHFIYIILNPLKKGEYSYFDGEYLLEFDMCPFYVGISKENSKRFYGHMWAARKCAIDNKNGINKKHGRNNLHKNRVIMKILSNNEHPVFFKFKENISADEAKRIEVDLIRIIGRKDIGLGCLTNRTDGGDGTSGIVITNEQRLAMSLKMKGDKNHFYGKRHTDEVRKTISENLLKNPARKNPKSEEHKRKIGIAHKGKVVSSETRKKLSLLVRGSKHPKAIYDYVITRPDGKVFISNCLKEFCIKNGLLYNSMFRITCYGRKTHRGGWTVFKILKDMNND